MLSIATRLLQNEEMHADLHHGAVLLLGFQVFVGAFYRSDPRDKHETHSVSRTLIHPGWNPVTNYNDIALLFLAAPAVAATLAIAPRPRSLPLKFHPLLTTILSLLKAALAPCKYSEEL